MRFNGLSSTNAPYVLEAFLTVQANGYSMPALELSEWAFMCSRDDWGLLVYHLLCIRALRVAVLSRPASPLPSGRSHHIDFGDCALHLGRHLCVA